MPVGRVARQVVPLNAIRMFSAVGRSLSLSRAAQELNVTASAVSHQIRGLEDYLGVRLLVRNGNRITLTPDGQRYLDDVSDDLLRVSRATQAIKAARGRVLRISVPLSFSALWLLPRIQEFLHAHPDISISVSASWMPVDLRSGRFDMAIRYAERPLLGARCDKLGSNEFFPICHPQLLSGRHALTEPASLRYHTLVECTDELQFDSSNPGWQGWLQAAGFADTKTQKYLNFSPRYLMQQAVSAGLGVGLSRTLLAADALLRQELVVPFGPIVTLASSYYVVSDERDARRPDIMAFRDWLISEGEATCKKVRLDEHIPKRA